MKAGVRLLGTCRRLLRAVSMIQMNGERSGKGDEKLQVYVLSGGNAARLSSSLQCSTFLLFPGLRSVV
jgi:hypothetical protein